MALTEDQIQIVRQGLASSFWNEVMRPVIANRANTALRALTLFPSERKGDWAGMSDDQIRAVVKECEWMLTAWTNEIAVYEHNRRLEELDAEQNGANLRT